MSSFSTVICGAWTAPPLGFGLGAGVGAVTRAASQAGALPESDPGR
jgi:hypothetical protein